MTATQQATTLHITLPLLAPSLNQAYPTDWRTKRRFSSKAMNDYKSHAVLLIRSAMNEQEFEYTGQRLKISLAFYFGTRQSHNRSDIDNRCKPTLDALGEALGFNDRCIDELCLRRGEYCGVESTGIWVEVLE